MLVVEPNIAVRVVDEWAGLGVVVGKTPGMVWLATWTSAAVEIPVNKRPMFQRLKYHHRMDISMSWKNSVPFSFMSWRNNVPFSYSWGWIASRPCSWGWMDGLLITEDPAEDEG